MTHAPRVRFALVLTFIAATAAAQTAAAPGQAQPTTISTTDLGTRQVILPWDQGDAGRHLYAKRLQTTGRLMMLTAHPDDEDGPTLTLQARGHGQQVLLMSLTRGEGGQNRTGSNLWDELGVLRTLELLESTRYYGTDLRFSHVADFGYSKSADETFKKWGGHEVPLRDIVYVIRDFKPDVLVSRWSGTARDGHGNHQAAGILAPEAVKCAADPQCFPDQLAGANAVSTWQVLKFYQGNQGDGEVTVREDVTQVDPDTGMSYARMSLEGFRHQASQLPPTLTLPSNVNWRSYKLAFSALPAYPVKPGMKEQDFFDGIDTSLQAMAQRPELAAGKLAQQDLPAIQQLIWKATEENAAGGLLEAQARLSEIVKETRGHAEQSAFQKRLYAKMWQLNVAASLALGLRLQATAPQRFISPAGTAKSTIEFSVNGTKPVTFRNARILYPMPQLMLETDTPGKDLAPGQSVKQSLPIEAEGLPVTRQHWFRKDPNDTTYQYTDNKLATWPLPPKPFVGSVIFEVEGLRESVQRPITAEGTNNAAVAVAPPVSILFDVAQQVRALGQKEFAADVTVRSVAATGPVEVRVTAPEAWKVTPPTQRVTLVKLGDEGRAHFEVSPVAKGEGSFELKAEAEIGGKKVAEGFSVVGREDLDTFYYYQPAAQRVSVVEVKMPTRLRIGYLPGAGDEIFPVLKHLGLNVSEIGDEELASGDLRKYDTIVVGIRGYDERAAIRAHNRRLLDFVKGGGTLLVQNQKAEQSFNSGAYTPFPATLSSRRVSVEEAPVEILLPQDRVWHSPNQITVKDFDGWVQERGVNFMSDWDPHFEPLLASGDPGEVPLKGGMLRAHYGKGTYIYTGYAFFRQLPAGIPGAVRLYMNLLNAGH